MKTAAFSLQKLKKKKEKTFSNPVMVSDENLKYFSLSLSLTHFHAHKKSMGLKTHILSQYEFFDIGKKEATQNKVWIKRKKYISFCRKHQQQQKLRKSVRVLLCRYLVSLASFLPFCLESGRSKRAGQLVFLRAKCRPLSRTRKMLLQSSRRASGLGRSSNMILCEMFLKISRRNWPTTRTNET